MGTLVTVPRWEEKAMRCASATILIIFMASSVICSGAHARTKNQSLSAYSQWEAIGRSAADRSLSLMKKAGIAPQKGNMIVLTNAGYAEVNGASTQGALDGLISVTGASRGRNTMVEIHTSPWTPLWFAVYDKKSGYCTYIEVNSSEADSVTATSRAFGIEATERIDADYLKQHASEYKSKFGSKVFGGNEFRIIAIANAIAAGAFAYVVRTLEFHDHYCPGVTSGILMVQYLKAHFTPGKSGYFVHVVDAWCKDDALMVLLGTTPAKGNFAVSYPTDADKNMRMPEAKNAANIIYRQDEKTQKWEGLILAFEWVNTSCPKTGDGVTDKLCDVLWYLERLDKPEDFVKIIKRFELPDGISPKDWARLGIDPLKMLGLLK
jgi:formylmethanofuran dehydrogenase subunit E-like metal-binding protein